MAVVSRDEKAVAAGQDIELRFRNIGGCIAQIWMDVLNVNITLRIIHSLHTVT